MLTVRCVGYCGCKFCWRCGFVRKECECPSTAMVVNPMYILKKGEEMIEMSGQAVWLNGFAMKGVEHSETIIAE